jgi:serine protease AprX
MTSTPRPRETRAKAVWGPKRFLSLAALLIFSFSAAAFAADSNGNNHRGGRAGGQSKVRAYKLDGELSRRKSNPAGRSSVIVTLVPGAELPPQFRRFARAGHLNIINGKVLDLPNSLIQQLEARPEIFQVHHNRPISMENYRTSFAIGSRAVHRGLGLTGTGVGVAVIDSGIATWHDDLTNQSPVSYPYGDQRVSAFVDFVNHRPLPYDDQGHGTHVAGIVAGNGFDSNGQHAGVAPDASLVSLKVLDANGQGTISNIIAALDWVLANHAAYNIRVVNLSVGAAVRESYLTDPLTLAAKRVVDAGVTVVAAAGNRGRNANGSSQYGGVTAPANAPWVLTVGASTSNGTTNRGDDAVASFSSRGPTFLDWSAKPDVVAPGQGAVSLADPLAAFYSSRSQFLLPGAQPTAFLPYLVLSGTSMAAPVVSGTVALMLQANPTLTPNAVKAIVQFTAQDFGYDALTQGAGLLNTVGAVRLAAFFANAQPGQPFPTQDIWSRRLIWGNHRIGGGVLVPTSNAFAMGTDWGASATSDGDNIVWGTACGDDCDNIVWGTNHDNIVWGTDDNIVWGTDDDNIVWGTDCGGADCDNIVWGTGDADNIVWGTADAGDNIVWGTAGDNIVWGTNDDNIVWGTDDNIVWGTFLDDNIVWGTNDFDNIVWGTDDSDNIVWGTVSNGQIVWYSAVGNVTTLSWNEALGELSDSEIFEVLAALSSPQPDLGGAGPAPDGGAPPQPDSGAASPDPGDSMPATPDFTAPSDAEPAPTDYWFDMPADWQPVPSDWFSPGGGF